MKAPKIWSKRKGWLVSLEGFDIKAIEAQFDRFTTPEPTTGCLLWTGPVDRDGYGRVPYPAEHRLAHRIAYLLSFGRIGDGLVIDHRCRQRGCVNVRHLEMVSPAENTVRGSETRVGEAQAQEIRRLKAAGVSQKTIAAIVGVSTGHVSNVVTGKWPHVYNRPPERMRRSA